MSDQYNVYVTRDDRLPDQGYTMGLEPLEEDHEVDLKFLPERDYQTLRTDDLEGAHAVISLKDKITEGTLDGLTDLEIIARFGAGFDNVDLDACTERGIAVTNAPQGIRHSVAQSTVGMLIVCASHMRRYDRIVRNNGFEGRRENMGVELFGKTLGTIGIGQIGTRVIELLEPFNMDFLTYDPYLSDERAHELGVEKVDLDTLIEQAQFISLHCPLTEETHHMLTEDHFRAMGEETYFVNTTRGGIYPDKVLATALENNWIAGAAIDVFENEPHVEGNPLLEQENTLVMPHIAGINKDGLTRTGNIASEAVLDQKEGSYPRNLLNPEVYDEPVDEDRLSPSYR